MNYTKSENFTSRNFLRKLDPTVFEKAAEIVKNAKGEKFSWSQISEVQTPYEGFSCLAIHTANGGRKFDDHQNDPHNEAFAAYFAPAGNADANEYGVVQKHPFWNYGLGSSLPERSYRRYRQERVNALLMMAAIVRQAKR